MADHDRELASAFDGQAARFERAPVQSDPAALERLVRFAGLPAGSLVLDAGCGPGLVADAFLNAGHRILGVDLSSEMIERAKRRCERHGERAAFEQKSLFDPAITGPFDAAVSRYVLHHVTDPPAFARRQVELLRRGGTLLLCDHATDPDPAVASHHEEIERGRDRTHTRNLTSGGLVDLLASAGLEKLELREEAFTLDFDEWFSRGTPALSRDEVLRLLLTGPTIRGYRPTRMPDGSIQIDCVRATVRGMKP